MYKRLHTLLLPARTHSLPPPASPSTSLVHSACVFFFNRTIIISRSLADPNLESPVWRRHWSRQSVYGVFWHTHGLHTGESLVEPYKIQIWNSTHLPARQKLEWDERATYSLCLYERWWVVCCALFFHRFFVFWLWCCALWHYNSTQEQHDDANERRRWWWWGAASEKGEPRRERTNHRLVIASFTYCENNVILTPGRSAGAQESSLLSNSFRRRRLLLLLLFSLLLEILLCSLFAFAWPKRPWEEKLRLSSLLVFF